jgi:RNA polymerase sigma-70 factor (ECF subfamily)
VTKPAASPQYVDVSEPELADFDAVYESEYPYVWKTLGRLGVPPSDLADAVHEVFVVLFRRWSDVDRTRLRAWLFGVARKVAAGMRRKDRETAVADIEPEPSTPSHGEAELLWKALAQLDEDRRLVVVLHDIEGRTGADIAGELGISVNTVHSRLRLARAELVTIVERLRGKP